MPLLTGSSNSFRAYADETNEIVGDRALVDRVLVHDARATESVFNLMKPIILMIQRQARLTVDEREDLLQQLFLHLMDDDYRRLRIWRTRYRCPLRRYLSIVARNLAIDSKRRPSSRESLLLDFPALARDRMRSCPDLTELLHQREQTRAIGVQLGRLPERDAELILRRHYRHETYREMASKMGLTVSNVGVALLRAEERMRTKLRAAYPRLFC